MENVEALLQNSSSFTLLVALAVLLLIFFITSKTFSSRGDKKEPPGPWSLPFIGNVLTLDLRSPHKTFIQVCKKYGPVSSFQLGPEKVVLLAGYKTLKEALVQFGEEFGERQPLNIIGEMKRDYGVLWTNGDTWKEMRRFALTNLRDFGMGKKVCEDKIHVESQYLVEVMKGFKGQPFDTTHVLVSAVSNIICSMVYGSRFEYEDPAFKHRLAGVIKAAALVSSPMLQLYNIFPVGTWLAPIRSKLWKHCQKHRANDKDFIDNALATWSPGSRRGFVDAFIARMQQDKEAGISSHFHKGNLMGMVIHLFIAGTETVTTTLTWALLFMAKYPQIQEQVREELSRVVGSRQVLVEDRKNLPFTDAVIHEIQRMADIAPMSLPHRTTRDITFHGYFIKKGTTVHPLISTALKDQSQWEHPYSFHPGHFLDEEGRFVKRDAFMPFSAGRRACPGESLARMELFVFFVSLIQQFRLTPSPGVSEDDLNVTKSIGVTNYPVAQKLCAIPCV